MPKKKQKQRHISTKIRHVWTLIIKSSIEEKSNTPLVIFILYDFSISSCIDKIFYPAINEFADEDPVEFHKTHHGKKKDFEGNKNG